jgi:hypothetical protein
MRPTLPLAIYVAVAMLGCTRPTPHPDATDARPSAANTPGAHAKQDPRIGKWVSAEEKPLGTVLILKANGTFSLGDIQNGKEYPDGLTGTWTAEERDCLCLKVSTSENCKISEGSELKFTATLGKDGRELVAFERVFLRMDVVP